MISLSRNTESMMHINSALAFGIPVIFFDKAPLNGLYDTIKIDDVRVGYKATQFLKENGANKIAGLFGHPNMSITRDRLLGFNKAVSEFGLNLISIKHTLNRQEAIEETKELVEEGVEGIFAMSDEIISGIIPGINLCETLKRKKPKIIGISDGQLPYFFNEEINFLHHDGELAGLRAAEKLLEKIENPESSKNIFTHIIETPIKCNLKSDLKILPV
jgi:LacI family transcriptional regulator